MAGGDTSKFIKLANEEAYQLYLSESRKLVTIALNGTTPQLRAAPSDFTLISFLGRGAFGNVILVRHLQTKEELAMKCISKEKIIRHKEMAITEKRILASLRHPNVMYLRYFGKNDELLFLFLPYISGGDLYQLLKKMQALNEEQAKFYMAQVVLGLEYLHLMNIIYRDLKPDNIILEADGYIKLSDYGLSKIMTKDRTCTMCGTPEYIAPEVIKCKGYGKSCDWWSYGVFSYELVAGSTPFHSAKGVMQIYSRIMDGAYRMPPNFSSNFRDLIKNLLQVNITLRIGCLKRGVRDIKKHLFFENTNWIGLFNREQSAPIIPPKYASDKPLSSSIIEAFEQSNVLQKMKSDSGIDVFDEF